MPCRPQGIAARFVHHASMIARAHATRGLSGARRPLFAPREAPSTRGQGTYDGVANAYTGGLFKWVGTGNNEGSNPAVIGPSNDTAVWTNSPIFDNVVTPGSTSAADFSSANPSMDVYRSALRSTSKRQFLRCRKVDKPRGGHPIRCGAAIPHPACPDRWRRDPPRRRPSISPGTTPAPACASRLRIRAA